MSNKERNRQIRLKYEKEREMKENPDKCFCDEPEIDDENDLLPIRISMPGRKRVRGVRL